MIKKYHTIIVKSTVLPGTTNMSCSRFSRRNPEKKQRRILGSVQIPNSSKRECGKRFFPYRSYCDRNKRSKNKKILEELYKPLHAPVFATDIKTAEMIKYVSNAFLATKISFANEIGNLCKVNGIDSYEVFRGVGMDSRINPHFFRSGIGFGGSCFPKDIHALISFAESQGIDARILKAVLKTNDDQPKKLIALLKKHLDIKGKTIGVLGFVFKPDTDDIRESRAIPVIRVLSRRGRTLLHMILWLCRLFSLCSHLSLCRKSADEVLDLMQLSLLRNGRNFHSSIIQER